MNEQIWDRMSWAQRRSYLRSLARREEQAALALSQDQQTAEGRDLIEEEESHKQRQDQIDELNRLLRVFRLQPRLTSPDLSETEWTLQEARRLWKQIAPDPMDVILARRKQWTEVNRTDRYRDRMTG